MPRSDAPGQPIDALVLTVSEFVGLLNQTLEFAYPRVTIVGELSNFRISKNRWVYFELKDELANIKCFGTVYMLPGPLEDGLKVQVSGAPRLHPAYGFSVNLQTIAPVGEGSLKRAADLLESKLKAEGLFANERKRTLPYPPERIGLITSAQSAAYADFIKILDQRWSGLDIILADVQVQGAMAPGQLVRAIEHFNGLAKPPEVLVITRGGGSAEDLAAFNNEQVTRAVAASRIPTLVAIGHEVDLSLAELAADQRASTPSNAAELLTPDKRHELGRLDQSRRTLGHLLGSIMAEGQAHLKQQAGQLSQLIIQYFDRQSQLLTSKTQLLLALSPQSALKRGYAVLRSGNKVIRSGADLKPGANFTAQLIDAKLTAQVKYISLQ